MYIKREDIIKEVEHSLHDNPHTDGIVRKTHNHEHEHFLRMLADQPAANVVPVEFKPGDVVWFTTLGNVPTSQRIYRIQVCVTEYGTHAYYETSFGPEDSHAFFSDAIGKTVFATEAEAKEHMMSADFDGDITNIVLHDGGEE